MRFGRFDISVSVLRKSDRLRYSHSLTLTYVHSPFELILDWLNRPIEKLVRL